MSLKKIIYLTSESDFTTLITTGSLTKDGKTLTYSPDDTDYRVVMLPENEFTCEMADGTTKTLKLYAELI